MKDAGTNSHLPDGRTLECGEMVNPDTGMMTAYEEIWRDETDENYLFVKSHDGNSWLARVGQWHLGLGRDEGGFWAWQSLLGPDGTWSLKNCTQSGEKHVYILPASSEVPSEDWIVLESSVG